MGSELPTAPPDPRRALTFCASGKEGGAWAKCGEIMRQVGQEEKRAMDVGTRSQARAHKENRDAQEHSTAQERAGTSQGMFAQDVRAQKYRLSREEGTGGAQENGQPHTRAHESTLKHTRRRRKVHGKTHSGTKNTFYKRHAGVHNKAHVYTRGRQGL